MKKKAFECVELQHEAGEKIMEKMRGMSIEEQVAYWKERPRLLREERAASRKARKRA
jgi:hypothetical protein